MIKKAIYSTFLILFAMQCSNQMIDVDKTDGRIKEKAESWPIFESFQDYSLNDFWPKGQDSTLLFILNDFDNNNRDLQLIDIQAKINTIYYDIGRADLFPKVSADISMGYGEQNLAGLGLSDQLLENFQDGEGGQEGQDGAEGNSSGSFGSSTYSARVNTIWELDLWGKIRNTQTSQKSKMLSNLYDLEYAKTSLKAQFIKAYISSIQINNEIKIFEENLYNLKKIKDIADSRILEGLSSPDEIHLASANYFLYESNFLTKKIEVKSIKRKLELMLGRYPTDSMSLAYQYPAYIYDIKSELSSDLIFRRPDVLSKKEKLNSSNSKLIANKKALFPSFAITNSIGRSSSDLETLFDPEASVWNVGLNILQPIFQSGQINKNIDISEQELSMSDIEYFEAVMNAFYETENYLDLDKSLKEVQDKIRQSNQDMEKAVTYAIRSYELGLVDLLYVLNLQQQLFNTKIQLENIIAKRYLNRIDLILALGGKFEY